MGMAIVVALVVLALGAAVALRVVLKLISSGASPEPSSFAPARPPVHEVASVMAQRGVAELRCAAPAGECSVWLELGLESRGGILSSGQLHLDVSLRAEAGGVPLELPIRIHYDGEDVTVTPRINGRVSLASSWPAGQLVVQRKIFVLPPVAPGVPLYVAVAVRPHEELQRFDVRLWLGAGA
ncbi:MAG: hypothetical protein K1X94_21010 [Sandaracinaceae bacterium]|nr:hypothetical protein [Sandaracinaceae bacterium]